VLAHKRLRASYFLAFGQAETGPKPLPSKHLEPSVVSPFWIGPKQDHTKNYGKTEDYGPHETTVLADKEKCKP